MRPRLLSILLATYVFLLVYASLMPFDFSAGPEDMAARSRDAWGRWPFESRIHTSRADVLSNIVVYVPLGWLATTRWIVRRQRRGAAAIVVPILAAIAAVSAALAISVAVEIGQLHGMTRVPSAQDVLMNTLGASVGAITGGLFGRAAWLGLVRGVRRRIRRRPVALAAGLMVVMLAVDGLFPLVPSIDVGTVKTHLKQSKLTLGGGLAAHPVHHWLVAKLGVYMVLTWLLAASSRRRGAAQNGPIAPAGRRGLANGETNSPEAPGATLASSATVPAPPDGEPTAANNAAVAPEAAVAPGAGTWVCAAGLAAGLALVLEMGKPFIMGGRANVANPLVEAAGVLAGLLTGLLARGWTATGRQKLLIAAVLLAGYLVYVELQPFNFAWNGAAARKKFPHGMEWLPLYHYAMGARPEDVRLFLRTLLLVGSMSGAIYLAGAAGEGDIQSRRDGMSPFPLPWGTMLTAGVLAGAFGAALESGQFFLAPRNPSTTDVFMFAAGGALGVRAGYEYLRRQQRNDNGSSQ